jgi:Asp-tRNA(Asn)/Glu-tRNA(Gln) amidotransferase A subunit family amidase
VKTLAVCIIIGAIARALYLAAAAPEPEPFFKLKGGPAFEQQKALAHGDITCHQVVEKYLDNILIYDAMHHSVFGAELNADAFKIADRLDARLDQGGFHIGPIFCLPIIINRDSRKHRPTPAGVSWPVTSFGFVVPNNPSLIAGLRDRDAVILGQTSTASTGDLSDYAARLAAKGA